MKKWQAVRNHQDGSKTVANDFDTKEEAEKWVAEKKALGANDLGVEESGGD
ncbi:hypothetical protein [Rhodococcus sp. PSBB049]|uniref:hypothetical protein n=1 Tax=Rhodococcus sp. PSBB049 TaxID=2812863 RepID=UPI00197D25C6|nr:hypothetical protein [Rhodococcus sp. PSBB049]QSE72504.1 hypothetical protein JYA91_29790 [Rhodococcus sp. PSBB049]